MKHYFKILSILIVTISAFTLVEATAQSCKGYEKRCESAPKYFESSSLQRSVSLRKARKVVINQTFFGEREYFVSVCGKNRLGKIHFRLIADDENETILYDNAVDNFKESQLFVIQSTMKIKIELSAPHYFDDKNAECAGIKVYYNRSGN